MPQGQLSAMPFPMWSTRNPGSVSFRSPSGATVCKGSPHMTSKRLEALADRVEIQDVLARYARGIDRADLDILESCYFPAAIEEHGRSEERRVGKEGVGTCSSRWSPYYYKKEITRS